MSTGFTLEAVRPLIDAVAPLGRSMAVTFRCPVSGERVYSAWAAPPPGSRPVGPSALDGVRAQVSGAIRGVLGYGHAGRAARALVDATIPSGAQLSVAEEERGLVEAFRLVSSRFAWHGGRWVHGSVVGERPGAPFPTPTAGGGLDAYDRDIAARMVIAVARSHGGVSDEERLHLIELFDGEVASLEALLARPPLTRAELAETTPANRRALLGVAWSMALCDEHFDDAEARVLDDLASGLGLDALARDEVRQQATGFVIDQLLERAFTWGAHDQAARDQIYAVAARIGVSEGAVQRAEARFQRRRAT